MGADEEDVKHRLSEIFDEDHRLLYTGIVFNNFATPWKKQANEDIYDTVSAGISAEYAHIKGDAAEGDGLGLMANIKAAVGDATTRLDEIEMEMDLVPLTSPDQWRQWYSTTIKLWREYNDVPGIDASEKIKPSAIRRKMLKLMMPIFPDLVSQADR
jgi:hypothetical protein